VAEMLLNAQSELFIYLSQAGWLATQQQQQHKI